MLTTLEERLRQRLDPVQYQAQFLSSLVDRGLLDPEDPAALRIALLNAMTAALQWFELYLPRTLVRRLLAHGDHHLQEPAEGEVTIMFTDMAGFSELAFASGPAETAALLNEHFRLLGRCIEAEGGTIDKYVGDSLMAFWSAPDPQPDHALRARRAACAIAQAVRADNGERQARGEKPINLRMGIATGVVLIGNIGAPGRIDYTVVGDVVNIAERLEQLGKEIERDGDTVILISDTTFRHTRGEFRTECTGAHTLRGRAEEIVVHRVRGVASAESAGVAALLKANGMQWSGRAVWVARSARMCCLGSKRP